MSTSRAPIFDELEDALDFDVSRFQPQPPRKPAGDPEALKRLSEAHNFLSRQPPREKGREAPARQQRRHRTGRNVQLNIKTRQETAEAFYRLCDQRGWLCAETFERAVAALARELESRDKVAT